MSTKDQKRKVSKNQASQEHTLEHLSLNAPLQLASAHDWGRDHVLPTPGTFPNSLDSTMLLSHVVTHPSHSSMLRKLEGYRITDF